MLTELLNSFLIKKLQLVPVTAVPSTSRAFDAWSYCSDGSCSGDCVGGCDGTARGEYGTACSDGSCSGDCVGGCEGTPAGGW